MSNTDFVHPLPGKRKLGRPPRITESQVADIVSSYATCTAQELASKHGLSKRYILKIWSRHGMKGKPRRKYAVDLNYFETIDSPVHHSPYTTPWNKVVKEASFVYVIGDKICEDLATRNVVQRKTRDYEPTHLPDSLMSHFTRGYFDGDGTIYKVGTKGGDAPSHYRLAISVNEKTGCFFQSYLEGKDIRSSLVEDKGSSQFQLRINDNLSKRRFIDLLYGDANGLFLTRKKALIDKLASCFSRQKEQGY